MTFGEVLKELLYKNRMSVAELAERVGLTRQTSYLYMNGKSKDPTLTHAKKICDVMGVSLDEMWRMMQG